MDILLKNKRNGKTVRVKKAVAKALVARGQMEYLEDATEAKSIHAAPRNKMMSAGATKPKGKPGRKPKEKMVPVIFEDVQHYQTKSIATDSE